MVLIKTPHLSVYNQQALILLIKKKPENFLNQGDILVDFILKLPIEGSPSHTGLLNLTQMLFWQTGLVMIIPVLKEVDIHIFDRTGTSPDSRSKPLNMQRAQALNQML